MATMQDALGAEWFSARGISEKFGKDYRYFLKDFFATEGQYAISNYFSSTLIGYAIEALQAKLEVVKVAPVAQVTKVEGGKNDLLTATMQMLLPIQQMIDTRVTDYLENESGLLAHVDEKIKAEAQKLVPTMITIGERPTVTMTGKLHMAFEKALRRANTLKQIYVSGEAGTGKTTLASQIATAMGLEFAHISCTMGMSEAHLLGRMDAHGNYLSSDFVRIYENGGVFLLDEVDAADSNTLLIINSALANGHMAVPNRVKAPRAARHKDFICVAAANTWGFGSNDFVGRNVLDAAFLDRFAMGKLTISYDTKLEQDISKDFPEMAIAIHAIRANVVSNRIKRAVSTRAIVDGVKLRMAGDSHAEVLETFMTGWTPEEKKKAMQGVK